MSVKVRLASLCCALIIGYIGLSFFASQDAQEVLPQKVLMPPNLTCKNAIYAVPLDSVFVKVDSLVTSREPNVTYKIRRMVGDFCIARDTMPSDSILLCCADVRDTFVNVIITATDLAGASTTCMATINLQDKLPPIISTTLPDVTVSCTFPFNFARLDTFGRYVNVNVVPRANIFENSQVVNDQFYDDFCGVRVISSHLDRRICGTGRIDRYFQLQDSSGNITRDTQIIFINNTSPFDPEAHIQWPRDTTIVIGSNQCIGTNPTRNLGGEPIVSGHSPCVMPTVTKSDMVFNDPLSGCPYIMRTWRVIEMCTYIPNNRTGSYEHVQNIYIQDTTKPTFVGVCKDTIFADPNNTCTVLVNLTRNATDNCTRTADLLYNYTVSQNGGVIFNGTTSTLNHTFALGTYDVLWSVDDRCGNIAICSHKLIVRENKPPTPIALQKLVIGLPQACEVTIRPSDFNINSLDNCTPAHQLRYSFSTNVNDTIRKLDCDNLGNNTLQFWVTDLLGNQAHVSIVIDVQDNNNHCPNNAVVRIEGIVMANDVNGLEEVKIILEGAEQQRAVMTQKDGSFSMSNLESNVSYYLTTNKTGDFLEGVNIMDFLELQKHYYGIKELETNTKKIAADIDGNGVVDHLDMSELRKLILGINTPAPNTPTWRVIDQSNVTDKNPWPLKETFEFKSLIADQKLALQAIKIGDINSSVVDQIEQRSKGQILWYYPDQTFVSGDKVMVKVYSSEAIPLTGISMDLLFKPEVLTFKNIKAVNADISQDAINAKRNGALKILHANAKGNTIRAEGEVFTIEFVALKSGKISEVLELSNDLTSYVVNTKDELINLNLVSFEPSSKIMTVAQNVPNPFDRYTSISFDIKDDMPVEISITDQTGRKIYNNYTKYTAGTHQINISDEQLGDLTGVFLVHIECAEVSEIRKILRVK